jgi:RND family efflux transporter MFP subunit
MKRIIVLVALAACARRPIAEKPLTPVEVMTVAGQQSSNGVRYSASVKPDWQLDLAFRVGGYVEDLSAQEGDRVAKGKVLARIRQSDYAQKVAGARGQVAEAAAAVTKARGDFGRAEKLFAVSALTKPELDAARAQRDAAEARQASANAMAQEAQLALGDASLAAPADAVVLRRNVERGSLVGPGVPAFTLAGTSSVKVAFGVPDLVVAQLKNGQELAVVIEALHKTFNGKISRIAPSADPKSRVFEIELTIPNAGGEIKPGMIASLQTNEATTRLAAVVPLDAIVRAQNDYAVFVVDGNGVAHARRVILGDMVGNGIAVTSGVAGGERVVSRGATIVSDGEKVRVMP